VGSVVTYVTDRTWFYPRRHTPKLKPQSPQRSQRVFKSFISNILFLQPPLTCTLNCQNPALFGPIQMLFLDKMGIFILTVIPKWRTFWDHGTNLAGSLTYVSQKIFTIT